MWTSGFFNSVNGDRVYNAQQMSEMFEGLISDGVFESVGNKLAVQPNSGMAVQIATGRGFFAKHWVNNTTENVLTLEASDVTLNRYCAVCVRVDETTGRAADPYLKYGEFATAPVKPTMERSDTVNEYCLAYVLIRAGATEITAADIEDTRANNELCGWVTGLIDQVDSATLWLQWEALFYDWFNNLQEHLDEDAETKIVADITDLQNRFKKVTGTFDGLGWNSQESGIYYQTIAVEGVTADCDIVVRPAEEYKEAYAVMGCVAVSQADGSITFEADNPDDINMVVEVIIINI